MNGIRFHWLWLGLLCAAIACTAFASRPARQEAEALVHSTIEDIRAAVKRDEQTLAEHPEHAIELVDQYVGPHVAAELAGRLILGRHWRAASEGQREAFVAAFRTLLLRTYAVHVGDYADANVEYLTTADLADDGSRVQVRTRVMRPGKPPAAVDYRLVAMGGRWKVFDAVVNGVSVVSTFRSAIDGEIREYGIDGLISRLEQKNQQPLL